MLVRYISAFALISHSPILCYRQIYKHPRRNSTCQTRCYWSIRSLSTSFAKILRIQRAAPYAIMYVRTLYPGSLINLFPKRTAHTFYTRWSLSALPFIRKPCQESLGWLSTATYHSFQGHTGRFQTSCCWTGKSFRTMLNAGVIENTTARIYPGGS